MATNTVWMTNEINYNHNDSNRWFSQTLNLHFPSNRVLIRNAHGTETIEDLNVWLHVTLIQNTIVRSSFACTRDGEREKKVKIHTNKTTKKRSRRCSNQSKSRIKSETENENKTKFFCVKRCYRVCDFLAITSIIYKILMKINKKTERRAMLASIVVMI